MTKLHEEGHYDWLTDDVFKLPQHKLMSTQALVRTYAAEFSEH